MKRIAIGKKKLVALSVFLLIFLCAAIPLSIMQHCNQLNEIPVIPIPPYPNSEFSEQSLREFSYRRMATIYYTSSATPNDIISYFDSSLDCNNSEDGLAAICRGVLENADGEYFYYVREDVTSPSPRTSIALEIRWKICNWDFEFRES
ncbi:MAG: hypothetical protein H7175_17955 [Burkholderiales bacterium]|nr:hypothetical protein [Anaerolineae bacterium]